MSSQRASQRSSGSGGWRCAACTVAYDLADRAPMVSVACGHSVCADCATSCADAHGHCPECATPVTGFVRNVEVLRALRRPDGSTSSGGGGGSDGDGDGESASGDEETVESDSSKGDPDLVSGPGVPSRPLGADVTDTMQLIDREALAFKRAPGTELGSGSSGTVYHGAYTRPGGGDAEDVAIKCVRAASREAADSERFRRELKLISRLADEHVVQFVGVAWERELGDKPPTILLVTELMRGGNLRDALAHLDQGLEIHSFLRIATAVAKGIVYLHEQGYAHRDIKSANVLLSDRPVEGTNAFPPDVAAKIADFGLSKSIDKLTGGAVMEQSVMEPGRLEATYAYLAPEAFGGDKTNVVHHDDDEQKQSHAQETAKKRDIYALGVLFWEMITGQVPWRGTSLPDVYVRVCVRSDRPTPTLEDTKVPKTLRRLVERCWAQDAKKRPSASSIVDKLQRITKRLNSVAEPKLSPSSPFPPSAAVAAAASTTVVTPLVGGSASVNSFGRTSSASKTAADAGRRPRDEGEAETLSTAPAAQLRRRVSSRAIGSHGEESAAALASKKNSHPHRAAPVPSPPQESSRDASKHYQPSHVPVPPDPNHVSPSSSPSRAPRQMQHPKRFIAPSSAAERLPRSASGVEEHSRARMNYSSRHFASAIPGEASVPNLAYADVAVDESKTRPTQRKSRRKKVTASFSRSPSYGGPVTTSGALVNERSLEKGRAARNSQRNVNSNRLAAVQEGDGGENELLRQTERHRSEEVFADFSSIVPVHQMDTPAVAELLGSEKRVRRLAGLALASLTSPQHSSNDDVMRAACAALHRLSVPTGYSGKDTKSVPAEEQLAIRKYLKYNDGISAILGVLDTPENRHPTTLSYALLAIGNLTAWDLDAHKQFREAQGVIKVSGCMKAHSSHLGMQEKGCYALACAAAAYPPRSKSEFLEAGCVDFVSNVLESAARSNRLNDAVAKQACAALGAMCAGNPINAARAALDGALANLIKTFDAFRNFSRTDGGKRSEMHLVCTAFMNLMCHNDNRRQAGNEGGTSLMIRSMRIFRLDADFVEKCLSTLSEFCTFRSNASHIVQMNGVDDIIASMVRFKTSVPVQRAGCRTLSALMKASGDQARRRVVHASGSEAMLFALERFGATTGVHAAVAVEGCRAIAALCAMESAEESEILAKRMKKIRTDRAIKQTLQAHRGNQAVEEKAREALKNLSSLKSGSHFFSRIRYRG